MDVETFKTDPNEPGAQLLGVAVCYKNEADATYHPAYITLSVYNKLTKEFEHLYPSLTHFAHEFHWAFEGKLWGWNVPFDKLWMDTCLLDESDWEWDGRIMWHLQNNDPAIRGFGLKLAQKKLLNWKESNDEELEANVRMAGGKLSAGDHYLADNDVLGKYACLDALSTYQAIEHLREFFITHSYHWMHDECLAYNLLLHRAGSQGIPVNAEGLTEAKEEYLKRRETEEHNLRVTCKNEIDAIENAWKVKRMATYKSERGRESYLASPSKWKRFNPSSGMQREQLMHTMLEFPIYERTPTGKAKTDRSNLSLIRHAGAAALTAYSEHKKVAEQAETYLNHVVNGRLKTNYDVCGTVSGRLSGFRPSLLNMPFSEPDIMKNFVVEEGYVGIHADLASIEPCVLAHYSEDPTLLKVYRQGQGDIYLDLALDVLPSPELVTHYNPLIPPTSAIKARFKDVRNICKTLHLAVSYTGTYITVAKNLSKNGYPTSKGEAMGLVKRYWAKFSKVREFEHRLHSVYRQQGSIRNLVGRLIQVPAIYEKDLLNRLIQSSAHDILRLWVTQIEYAFKTNGVQYKYWLPDIHDSTTFMVKREDLSKAKEIYALALQEVQSQIQLSVPISMELKECTSLAGVKGE